MRMVAGAVVAWLAREGGLAADFSVAVKVVHVVMTWWFAAAAESAGDSGDGARISTRWRRRMKDIKVKKSKNEQKPTRNEETSDQEKDLKPISKAGSRPWLRKDVKERQKFLKEKGP
ncbi:hypothetical protein Tco_0032439 [Tanacetum coccineum]